MIEIYTDGSARKNGAECGYGVCAINTRTGKIAKTCSIQCENSTNNQEELKAIIHAFSYIERLQEWNTDWCPANVVIYSDSAYCVNMYNQWIDNWEAAGWKKYDKKPIENLELVKTIYNYKHKWFTPIRVEKVNGHCNIIGNEIADALATGQTEKAQKLIDNL